MHYLFKLFLLYIYTYNTYGFRVSNEIKTHDLPKSFILQS